MSVGEANRKATRRWREKNPEYFRDYYRRTREQQLAQQKVKREADPEAFRARRQAAYERNPDPQRERSRRYREQHPEYVEKVREWRKANPQRRRELKRKSESKRRAQKLALPFEEVDPLVVFERDEGICGICGGSVDSENWHLDHVVPLAQGGSHTYANVQTTHPSCNLSKGGRGHERQGRFK